MATTYNNLLTTATPREGVDFIAIYGTTTYNEISGALANEQMVFVKVTYDTDKYRYAPLTDQTAIDGETNYYTFTCTINNIIYTYKVSDADAWTTASKNVTDNTLPSVPDSTNNYELTCKAGTVAWTAEPSIPQHLYIHTVFIKWTSNNAAEHAIIGTISIINTSDTVINSMSTLTSILGTTKFWPCNITYCDKHDMGSSGDYYYISGNRYQFSRIKYEGSNLGDHFRLCSNSGIRLDNAWKDDVTGANINPDDLGIYPVATVTEDSVIQIF